MPLASEVVVVVEKTDRCRRLSFRRVIRVAGDDPVCFTSSSIDLLTFASIF